MTTPTRPETIQGVTDLDRLLHEPSRLLITTILYPLEEADFLYLLRESGLTKGNLSSHVAKLEQAGYVEVTKTYQGKVPLTIYRLTERRRTPRLRRLSCTAHGHRPIARRTAHVQRASD